jgi:hypothetical protein
MWLLDTAVYSPSRQALNNTRWGEQILPARLLNWIASSNAESINTVIYKKFSIGNPETVLLWKADWHLVISIGFYGDRFYLFML